MSKTFTIYAIEKESDIEHLTEEMKVEMGLSSGELRQSILDRLNEELDSNNISIVNNCLLQYDLVINEKNSKKNIARAKKDVENVLYCIKDEDINNTFWKFPEELLYIHATQE